jgi:cytoskeletal protein RodZ
MSIDAKTTSEVALALCLAGAVVVWAGLRFDLFGLRWGGMAVIVLGLLGLIFNGSLSRPSLASGERPVMVISSSSISPSPTAEPTPTSHTKKHQKKQKKKPKKKQQPPPQQQPPATSAPNPAPQPNPQPSPLPSFSSSPG